MVPPSWAKLYPNAQKAGYLRSDVDKFIAEYDGERQVSPEMDEWLASKAKSRDSLVEHLQGVEDFCEINRIAKLSAAESARKTRIDYYQKQALSLDPPLTPEMLKKCDSYRRAIRISRTPADLERSWVMLASKLKEEQLKARMEIRHRRLNDYRQKLCLNYNARLANKAGYVATEQRYIAVFADAAISSLKLPRKQISSDSLVPFILNRVRLLYDRHNKTLDVPNHMKYQPIMEDARMIYKSQIVPFLDQLTSNGQHLAHLAHKLRCAFCTPAESGDHQLYGFESLFNHMWYKHSVIYFTSTLGLVGVGTSVEIEAGFQWLTTEWPHILPILAAHQAAPTSWDHERVWDEDFRPEWLPHEVLSPAQQDVLIAQVRGRLNHRPQ